jgi:hypothetical protein
MRSLSSEAAVKRLLFQSFCGLKLCDRMPSPMKRRISAGKKDGICGLLWGRALLFLQIQLTGLSPDQKPYIRLLSEVSSSNIDIH